MVSLVRAVLSEVLWKCGVDVESVVSTERWELKGMSVNLEGESRTTATFWRWKERELMEETEGDDGRGIFREDEATDHVM